MNGTAMISVPADGRFTDEMAMRGLDLAHHVVFEAVKKGPLSDAARDLVMAAAIYRGFLEAAAEVSDWGTA